MLPFLLITLGLASAEPRPSVVVVIGAAGATEFEATFQKCADQWQAAADKGKNVVTVIGRDKPGAEGDRDQLRKVLAREAEVANAPLWVVLIGHGTDDGREARFNLRGPDVTARELAEWLAPVKRPVAVVNCASASGSFVNLLSGANRVVVTATRSGSEANYARFGQYLAAAFDDPTADVDRDGQVSLLEAFLTASHRVAEFYRGEGRLATEHALLDDNGDKLGSSADWFQGVRAVKRAKDRAAADGVRAHQWHLVPSDREKAVPAAVRQRRDELEQSLAALREQKEKLAEDEYYARLEKVLVDLARLYEEK
ncbi:hypothetical protein [Limnoglobus roseus]|uniref:Uncharacterized protein n=1 Tax=Limnoglobus roseus TaxID=2598579 RepID=A0A5C1AKB6_9BACT|nr:hypothetical protein [Limnoglobus roseus]QEL19651.1 hypothetical protein PX52LOC_06728 [Limnoglobus roseus]